MEKHKFSEYIILEQVLLQEMYNTSNSTNCRAANANIGACLATSVFQSHMK